MATPSSNMADYINGDLYILHIKAGELQKLNVDKLLGGVFAFLLTAVKYVTQQA